MGDGFGQTWFKRFAVDLGEVEPEDVIALWKREFSDLWPQEAEFRAIGARIAPGAIAEVELAGPVGSVITGVVVDDAAARHFTLRTPEGHMFAGWIRFKAEKVATGTEGVAEMMVRPSDPIYQLGLWLGGNSAEDRFWVRTLEALARRFGAAPSVRVERRVLSHSFNWRAARNVRNNAALQSFIGRSERFARAAVHAIMPRR